MSGESFAINLPGASGARARGLAEYGGALYVESDAAGEVYDFTAGGNLSTATPYASGLGAVTAIYGLDGFGLFAANLSMVYDISTGGDVTGGSPFAVGLGNLINGQMLYWHGCGDQIVWDDGGEECDDGNAIDGDGCSASCADEGAGGGGGAAGGAGGTGGTAGTGGTGGTAGTGGTSAPPVTESEDDGGCGCRAPGNEHDESGGIPIGMAVMAMLGLARLRRRP